MIKAIHLATGRKGNFSEAVWELLPPGKDGWQIEVPEEVKEDLDKKAAAEKKAAEKKAVAEKKAADKGKSVDKAQSEDEAGEGDPAEDEADADETNL